MREPRDETILTVLRERFGLTGQCGAEVGVSFGVLSVKLLELFPALVLDMIDRWELPPRRPYSDPIAKRSRQALRKTREEATRVTEFAAGRRRIVHADSVAAAAGYADGSLDWVLVDADHSREAVLEDLAAWWPKVRTGGLVLCDDIATRLGKEWGWGVEEAMNEFCRARGLAWRNLGHGVGVIEKY